MKTQSCAHGVPGRKKVIEDCISTVDVLINCIDDISTVASNLGGVGGGVGNRSRRGNCGQIMKSLVFT